MQINIRLYFFLWASAITYIITKSLNYKNVCIGIMDMKVLLIFSSIILVILIAGCTSTSSINQTGPSEKQFSLTIGHTFYNPSTITVNEGDFVKIMAVSSEGTGLESGNSHNHGFAIDEYWIDVVAPSETVPVVIAFTANKTGTFSVYCKSCWNGPFGRGHPDIRAQLIVNP